MQASILNMNNAQTYSHYTYSTYSKHVHTDGHILENLNIKCLQYVKCKDSIQLYLLAF